MNHLTIIAISALSLALLSACEQKTASSVGDTSIVQPASSASTPAAPSHQTLSSQNGKISLTVSGQFTDQLAAANELISDIPSEQLLLLQQDSAANVLLYAADLGPAKTDATTYLNQLSAAVKADAGLNNVAVGAISGQQLTYQFSETTADGNVNQACVAIHQEHIYSVCAISSSMGNESLAALLTSINIH